MTTEMKLVAAALIERMCMTYRHDFRLLPINEQDGLRRTMQQIYEHDIAPHIAMLAAPGAPAPEPVSSLDWPRVAKVAGKHGIRYRTNFALEKFLSEITTPPAPVAASAVEWRPIHTAPEDTHVILATRGGFVGEALMIRDEDTGRQKWTWALGPVHPNHVPLGWMPMPSSIDQPVGG